jgi:RNA polymerase primary sigma factor
MYTTSDDRDLLDLYIEELRGEPVLSAQQQKDLARAMRRATTDDARERARSELIRANLRFAFSVAKQYQNRGVPLGDLVSEANAGLVRAADKYDPEVGVNFISYAVWWIRQALHSAVQRQGRTVQVPLNRAADLSRVSRAQEVLRQKLSREPHDEEIATVADLSLDVTRGLVALLQPVRSLDEPTLANEPGGGRTLGETLVLERGEDEDVLPGGVESDSRREAIARALEVLQPRDRRVLTLYFGLEGSRPMTLQEIARELGVTRERVRQLRDRALKRLRESDTAEVLRDGIAA